MTCVQSRGLRVKGESGSRNISDLNRAVLLMLSTMLDGSVCFLLRMSYQRLTLPLSTWSARSPWTSLAHWLTR